MDFVYGNDQNYLKLAEKLGIKELIVITDKLELQSKIIKLKTAHLVKSTKLPDIRKEIKKSKTDYTIIKAHGPKFNRFIIEHTNVNFIFDLENSDRKDFIHHRNSGLNQVLAKLLVKKNKTILVSFTNILNSQKPNIIIGRIRQNKKLSNKYKFPYKLVSLATKPEELRSPHDLNSLKKII